MGDFQEALETIIQVTVNDMASQDIREVASELPSNPEDSAEAFCKRFSLGYWLMESFIEHNIDIPYTLNQFADLRAEEESEEEIESRFIDHSLRRAQGWVR